MTMIKTAARHLAAGLAAVAVAAGMLALAGGAARAAAPAHRSCSLAYTVAAVNNRLVDLRFTQTCGISYRAWRRWGASDVDLGTYRKTGCPSDCGDPKHSVACDVTSCQTHNGVPTCYGWQRKDTGATHTIGGCAGTHTVGTHTVALVRRSCSGECLGWSAFKVSDTTTRFESWWKQNVHNRQQRARARCVDRVNNRAYNNYGNWKTNGDRSRSTCNAPYILVHGCIQTRARAGAAITTTCPYPAASVVLTAAYGKQVKAGRVKYG